VTEGPYSPRGFYRVITRTQLHAQMPIFRNTGASASDGKPAEPAPQGCPLPPSGIVNLTVVQPCQQVSTKISSAREWQRVGVRPEQVQFARGGEAACDRGHGPAAAAYQGERRCR
jgi:hypothetical protein